ncbi:MAG TPA: SURF1 family protein [Candidatus Aquabacterium excrementipullorum]|nr:SURF1 family protein [Candidatus Aquabacterium excrementipullorum]
MRASRPLIVLLATLIGVGATVSLGQWQLRRAALKQSLHDTMEAHGTLPALDNAALPCDAAAWSSQLQRRVALRGRWLNERTVWLENRAMAGRAGLLVLTPLALEMPMVSGGHCAATVLVQRGWVPRDPYDRTRVPPPPAASGAVLFQGRLVEAPSSLLELGAPASAPAGAVRQNIDLAALAREWGTPLRPGSIQQEGDEVPAPPGGTGLLREWWRPALDVGRHQAYAAQWFAMAAVMVVLYVWFQWIRPRRKPAA